MILRSAYLPKTLRRADSAAPAGRLMRGVPAAVRPHPYPHSSGPAVEHEAAAAVSEVVLPEVPTPNVLHEHGAHLFMAATARR